MNTLQKSVALFVSILMWAVAGLLAASLIILFIIQFTPEAKAGEQTLVVKWSGISCKPALIAPSFIKVPLPAGCVPDGFFGELIAVQVAPPNTGFITSTPEGIQCGASALWAQKCVEDFKFDTAMTLKASPVSGKKFDHWSGCSVSNNAVIQVIPHSVSKPCVANFK